MQSMHEAFPLLPGGPNINSTLLAVSNLSPRLCRKNLSPKFRPVWVRGTSRRDQILVPFFEAKMTSSHDGACPRDLIADDLLRKAGLIYIGTRYHSNQ